MNKKIVVVISCLLVTFLSFKAFALKSYPDLSPEYLQTFDSGSKYIVEMSEKSKIVRVYDGATGKFLYAKSTDGLTDQQDIYKFAIDNNN